MTIHKTWVDEDVDHEGDPMWAAVCEGCSWSSRWVHRDEFVHLLNGKPISDEDLDENGEIVYPDGDFEFTPPDDQANDEAARLGREHEEGNE